MKRLLASVVALALLCGSAHAQSMPAGTVKGRALGAGTGFQQNLTASQVLDLLGISAFVRTILDDVDAAAVRATIGAGTGSGTVTSVTGTAPIASSGGAAPAISLNDDGVTYAKLQNVSAASRLLGRGSAGGAGDPEELTPVGLVISGTNIGIDIAAVANANLASAPDGTLKGRVIGGGAGSPIDLVQGAGGFINVDLLDGLSSAAFAILTGQAGGQTLRGGTASGDDLTLDSTSHATKGDVLIQPSGGKTLLGVASNAGNANGLTVNQGASDDEALSLKSSDVAHGMTTLNETDTFAAISKVGANDGGIQIRGLTEVSTAVYLSGCYTTDTATRSTAGIAPVMLVASLKSGTTVTNPAADKNIVAFAAGSNTRWIADSDGDTWQSGTALMEGLTASQLVRTTSGKVLESVGLGASLSMPSTELSVAANASTADQQINASTNAYVTGSLVTIPAGKYRIGSVIHWRVHMSKTAAATAAGMLVIVESGTNGSAADTNLLTFTQAALQTGVVDDADFDVYFTIRGPLSASCLAQGSYAMSHNGFAAGAGTGFAVTPTVNMKALSGTWDCTAASLKAGLSITTTALQVVTIQQVVTEVMNL